MGSMHEDTHLRLPPDLKRRLAQYAHDTYRSLNLAAAELLTVGLDLRERESRQP